MKNLIYQFSSRFFLTSQMTKRIEKRMSILYPTTRFSLIRKTADYLIGVYLTVMIAALLLMMFAEFSIYYTLIVFLVLYALASNRIYAQFDKLEMSLLYSLQKFLEDVKYRFRFDGMLEEALQEAINIADYNMAIHGEKMYSSLKDYHLTKITDYDEIAPNSYFRTFYMMCKNVVLYGDKKVDGESYFIKNLSYLKDDIGIEILKRNKVNNMFMGLLGITIIPVFAIKPIEKWSISNIPELSSMHSGLFGILTTIILGIISFAIYNFVLKLKYPYVRDMEKAEWVKRLSDNDLMRKLVLKIIRLKHKKSLELERKLKNIGYPYDIIEFYVKRLVMTFIAMCVSMILIVSITMSTGVKFHSMWMILSVFICGIIMYAYQYFEVVLKESLMLMNREEELVRFQTIILMLKETDRISVKDILNQMEIFSYSFKGVLEEILYKYPYMGMKVFDEIKGKSGFLGFDRLMDNFRACDYMSINQAFRDVDKEREYYIAKHKQDNDFMVEERSMIAKVISFVPLCMVIITKLIIPFVVEGMGQIKIF